MSIIGNDKYETQKQIQTNCEDIRWCMRSPLVEIDKGYSKKTETTVFIIARK